MTAKQRHARHNYGLRESGRLSDAERDVIRLLASGLTAKGVALQRGTSARTVEMQLVSAREKSGCKTNPQLCVWALMSGAISYGRAACAADLGIDEGGHA
jgi:DNA-binding CsgD family transcriptional regulator